MNESVRSIGGKTLTGENQKYSQKNLYQCYFVQHKSHKEWAMSPWCEASNQPPVPHDSHLSTSVCDSTKSNPMPTENRTASAWLPKVSRRWHEHALFPVKVVTILLILIQYKQQEFSKLLDCKSLKNTERPGSAWMDYLQRSKWGRSHNVTCPVSAKLFYI